MTTENEKEQEQADKDEAAGFAAGFNDEAIKAPKPEAPAATPAPTPAPEAPKDEEAAPQAPSPTLSAEEIAAVRAAAAELPTLKSQLRDAHGRIGALNDLLKQTREQKKDEGKPPTLTAVELKRIKERYPELAEDLNADITEALASIKQPTPTNPEDITKLVNERVAEVSQADRKQMLADEHPDWENIKKGEDLWKWIATLPKEEAHAFQNSTNPLFVAKKLTVFKDWLAKASKAKEKSQERLEQAIAPTQGTSRPGKQTLSDDEAMAKGFAEGFNS